MYLILHVLDIHACAGVKPACELTNGMPRVAPRRWPHVLLPIAFYDAVATTHSQAVGRVEVDDA